MRVVVIAAAGPVFCAGHDLREIRADPRPQAHDALFEQCSRVMARNMETADAEEVIDAFPEKRAPVWRGR